MNTGCINGHSHCFKDVGLNLAECRWCGMVIMHDMSRAEFELQDCSDRPTEAEIAEYGDYMQSLQADLAEHQNDEPSGDDGYGGWF